MASEFIRQLDDRFQFPSAPRAQRRRKIRRALRSVKLEPVIELSPELSGHSAAAKSFPEPAKLLKIRHPLDKTKKNLLLFEDRRESGFSEISELRRVLNA